MMRPIINNNGDTRESLVDQRRAVIDALRVVVKALWETAPNGRNYIGNAERFAADKAIYAARFAMLDQISNEITDEALAIKNPARSA